MGALMPVLILSALIPMTMSCKCACACAREAPQEWQPPASCQHTARPQFHKRAHKVRAQCAAD